MRLLCRKVECVYVIVRDEQVADRAAIHDVVKAAFGRQGEADLVDSLREHGSVAISLVALDEEEIVGHVLLSKLEAPFAALGLAPLAVRPDRQHSGVGSRLVRAALERANNDGWRAVFVLGDPEYYRRFGFDVSLASGFRSPYAGPHFMVFALTGELPVSAGAITYARPFGSLD
jgi:putative acetyltransferase